MNNKKNIERLFQEKFKDFNATPPENMWERIDASLDKKAKENRKVIPIWWKLGGTAAAIALLILAGNLFFNAPQNTIPNRNSITNAEKDTLKIEEKENINKNDAVANTSSNKNTDVEKSGTNTQENPKAPLTNANSGIVSQNASDEIKQHTEKSNEKDHYIENHSAVSVTSEKENKQNTENKNILKEEASTTNNAVVTNSEDSKEENSSEQKGDIEKKSLLDVASEMEKEKELASAEKTKTARWSVNPNVAPVYYNSLSKGSPINTEFSSNSKEGAIRMSYGINIAYNVSKRLSVRSGINNVNMGYSTNDVSYSPVVFGTSQSLSNVDFINNDTSLNISSNSQESSKKDTGSQFEARTNYTSEGTMRQEFGYIEVPMELKYRLVDKRFGINVIGGMSSLFLTNNEVSIQSSNLATEVGEANNLNDISFSTNIGVGLDYQVSNKLLFNLEPMFKYQLNTFSREDGGFSPYILGVYTGLSFKF